MCARCYDNTIRAAKVRSFFGILAHKYRYFIKNDTFCTIYPLFWHKNAMQKHQKSHKQKKPMSGDRIVPLKPGV